MGTVEDDFGMKISINDGESRSHGARATTALIVLCLQLANLANVGRLGVGLGGVLFAVPRVPFGLARKVEHARSRRIAVAYCCLLEKSIQLQQFGIGRFLRQILDLVGGGGKFGRGHSVRQSKSDSKMG